MKEKWIDTFVRETNRRIGEPFFQCLAAAIATVESSHGAAAIAEGKMLNEIGYKALAGKPSKVVKTQEATGPGGTLVEHSLAFRLFRDRIEQGMAIEYLMRSSMNFEAARLLFVLAFYAGYAPGRTEGLKCVVRVFNMLAASGRFEGVKPLGIVEGDAWRADEDAKRQNHQAAREAVMLFAELTGAGEIEFRS